MVIQHRRGIRFQATWMKTPHQNMGSSNCKVKWILVGSDSKLVAKFEALNIFGGWNGINYPIFRAKKIEASPLQGYTNIEPASQIMVEYPQNGGFFGGCMSTEEPYSHGHKASKSQLMVVISSQSNHSFNRCIQLNHASYRYVIQMYIHNQDRETYTYVDIQHILYILYILYVLYHFLIIHRK